MGGFFGSLFGGGNTSPPPVIMPAVPAPVDNTEKIKAAAAAEAERIKKRKGFASTIVSNGVDDITNLKKTMGE